MPEQIVDMHTNLSNNDSMENEPRKDREAPKSSWLVRCMGALANRIDKLDARAGSEKSGADTSWKIYAGEGRAQAAGSEWIQNINVDELLHTSKVRAAFEAGTIVDRAEGHRASGRTEAVIEQYRSKLEENQGESGDSKVSPEEEKL